MTAVTLHTITSPQGGTARVSDLNSKLEGTTVGASVRLWEFELPDKFELLHVGQVIRVKTGPFAGSTFRVIGKLRSKHDCFTFCTLL